MARAGLIVAVMAAFPVTGLPAQRAPAPLVSQASASVALSTDRRPPVSQQTVASAGRPVAGAHLGGVVGMAAGGLAGLYIGGNRCRIPGASDTCQGIEGLLIGAGAGITLGVPVGAHLLNRLNRRQGSLPPSLLASAAIAGAGVAAIFAVDRNVEKSRRAAIQVPLAVAIPVLQVVSATIIETRTSRR